MLALKPSTAPHLSKGAARSGDEAAAEEKSGRSDPPLAPLRQQSKTPMD